MNCNILCLIIIINFFIQSRNVFPCDAKKAAVNCSANYLRSCQQIERKTEAKNRIWKHFRLVNNSKLRASAGASAFCRPLNYSILRHSILCLFNSILWLFSNSICGCFSNSRQMFLFNSFVFSAQNTSRFCRSGPASKN